MSIDGLTVSRSALLADGSDQAFRQLVQDLLAVAARMEAFRSELGRIIGVSGPQYSLLAAVAFAPPGEFLTVTLLAARLHVSTTYVTAEAGKLVNQRLLAKVPNPDDRRSSRIVLTPKGERAMRGLLPILSGFNDNIFHHLKRDTFATVRAEVAAIVPALDEVLRLAATATQESA